MPKKNVIPDTFPFPTKASAGRSLEEFKEIHAPDPIVEGQLRPETIEKSDLPSKRKKVKRFLLTSAQNNTNLNEAVWNSLHILAKHYSAEVLCASYSYNTAVYGALSVKNKTYKREQALWFDPKIVPYLDKSDRNIEIAPGLVWCGRMNTIPTAVRPLSGFETYTGRKSGIFPHAKLSMESIASGKYEATKFNYTTGTVTQLNYIQKKAGLRAEHFHSYGGLLVEVDSDGRWYVRQLVCAEDGTVQDLDIKVENGKLTRNNTVEAITWGDIHVARLDPEVERLAWTAKDSVIDVLRPRYQFMHDILDFRSRNHHERNNPHRQYELLVKKQDSVTDEIADVARFLRASSRPYCETIVVSSNHDNALMRWIKEADWKHDLLNAEFYLEANLEVLRSIRETGKPLHIVEWATRKFDEVQDTPLGARFLGQDESFVICRPVSPGMIGRDGSDGIECGMHGDLGPNGSKASPGAMSRMGRRVNIGHSHSAGIIDGVYVSGVSGSLDMDYNVGPSSWSHSHIITYKNGSRAIITMWDNKWRA